MGLYRLFVEKKDGYNVQAKKLKDDIMGVLGIAAEDVRVILRYDIEGLSEADYLRAEHIVFSEPPCDKVYEETVNIDKSYAVFAAEYLPGQYDQRADSAEQCVQLLTKGKRPVIRCATVYAVKGVNSEQLEKIRNYIINPVESREASLEKPETLISAAGKAEAVPVLKGFTQMGDREISVYHKEKGFAMSDRDLMFVRDYFKGENRNPTETEIKVIDTYWSDHCRHTTFLTELKKVEISATNGAVKEAYGIYKALFNEINGKKPDKYPCLMDIATIGAKKLKLEGYLDDLDISDENNACSIKVKAEIDGKPEDWLVMFKNETHNHPTEIEPFGGAATCLGGAIRDPLSGRAYVYQAMRVTGCADPTRPVSETLPGKLAQRVITKTAATGFSSYGNQIGLATGIVAEIYHKDYVAKRLETGFVVGAAPVKNVYREKPAKGDVVLLLGGDTGRDGCGGATGSSKAHTKSSVEKCGAEVQKGNPLTERKIQRLFTDGEVTKLIKKCNDFGAGGVCVAIGELADSLLIDLNAVPKKYSGLSGTELAISESQERMAVVTSPENVQKFISAAAKENLNAVAVASVTETGRLQMQLDGRLIVDIARSFLDTNGVKQAVNAKIEENTTDYIFKPNDNILKDIADNNYKQAVLKELSRLNVCSQKGLGEIFDGTIGAASVYMPFGGKYRLTPAVAMAAKLPAHGRHTEDCTVSSFAYYPGLSSLSPFAGSAYAILGSIAKLVACGADMKRARLTLQEFFKRLKDSPERWGQPLSALLGALTAQLNLKAGAIGGKDSMSGSFENYDVPPTLISFALAPHRADRLIANVLESSGVKLYLLKMRADKYNMPDFGYARKLYASVYDNINSGNVKFATVTDEGGTACAVIKSCLGNGLGFAFENSGELFAPLFGSLIISAKDVSAFKGFDCEYIGESRKKDFTVNGCIITIEEAVKAFTGTLENVFRTVKKAEGVAENISYNNAKIIKSAFGIAKPRVFIPVFPGTNCEFDTAKKFAEQGAEPVIYVVKNRSAKDIEESVSEMAKIIGNSQIIAFPGGFSGGDEPDGSGKFIAATFRNPRLSDSVQEMLKTRDGLIIGICNGFQALIKTGLVPYGEIREQKDLSPTLTFNTISRHVSEISEIRVASNKSPWLYGVKTGEVYSVAVSHGEGRFVCTPEEFKRLCENGQIATQYADLNGNATMESLYNPNGSYFAVEGITSPDGRVLGKMGHSERTDTNLYKNIDGNFEMKIFESGVKYFR